MYVCTEHKFSYGQLFSKEFQAVIGMANILQPIVSGYFFQCFKILSPRS